MTQLVKYSTDNSWALLRELQENIGQLFIDKGLFKNDGSFLESSHWTPRVDVREEPHQFVLIADLPGVDPKEIDISMENNTLNIKGERKIERKIEEHDYSRIERFSGTFHRRFTLSDQVKIENISASFKQGVLEVILHKKESETPRRIEVQVLNA